MQFKHPEILYFLFALLIPILVHLFQLRKFKIQYFSNVKLLKELELQTRKSSQLKKWLLLATRLLLLAFLILAFAQPFFKSNDFLKQKNELVVVLDNSFSMQAKGNNGELLKRAIQDIVENTPENLTFSLITTTDFFYDTSIKSLQQDLQKVSYSNVAFNPNAILNKINAKKPNVPKDVVFITDAANLENNLSTENQGNTSFYFLKKEAVKTANAAIETIVIHEVSESFYKLKVSLRFFGEIENDIPVSLSNQNKLVGKILVTKASIENNTRKDIFFTIPKEEFHGMVRLTDNSLSYDNDYYFSISKPQKSNVIGIGTPEKNAFLGKIFNAEEFNWTNTTADLINFAQLEIADCVILNELETIPEALASTLLNFYSKGGNIVFVPNTNGNESNYNSFLKKFGSLNLNNFNVVEKKITQISFNHPLYSNVFEKKVANFQYPNTQKNWTLSGTILPILQQEDKGIFLGNISNKLGNLYVFNTSIHKDNSNFKNSPLIVPTFYNMGQNSAKTGISAHIIGNNEYAIIDEIVGKDKVLSISNAQNSFIPMQQILNNKIKLSFGDYPEIAGNYSVYKNKDVLKNISFNYKRNESNLSNTNDSFFEDCTKINKINTFYSDIIKNRSNNEVWKYFAILAFVMLLIEILIQKLLK